MFITNSFSINMLTSEADIRFEKIPPNLVRLIATRGLDHETHSRVVGFESAIGHVDTAVVVSNVLGIDLPASRATITLNSGDSIVVAQYTGPRLPEGATTLPELAKITFWKVTVNSIKDTGEIITF